MKFKIIKRKFCERHVRRLSGVNKNTVTSFAIILKVKGSLLEMYNKSKWTLWEFC